MNETALQRTEDGSIIMEKAQQNSSSSIKDLAQSQSNGGIDMKGNNDNSHNFQIDEPHKIANGFHEETKRKSKRPWRKHREKTSENLSDSNSSSPSSSSSSDESDIIVQDSARKGDSNRSTKATANPADVENALMKENGETSYSNEKGDEIDGASESSKKEKESLEKLLSDALVRNEVLTVEMEEYRKLNEDLLDNNASKVDMEKQLQDSEEKYRKLLSIHEQQENAFSELQDNFNKLANESESQKKEIEEFKQQEKSHLKLQVSYNKMQVESERQRTDIEELSQQLADAKKEIEGQQQNSSANEFALNDELKTAISDAKTKEQEIQELKIKLEKSSEEAKLANENEIRNLKSELENSKSKVEDCEKEISELRDQVERAKKEIESKDAEENDLEVFREELENSKATVEKQEQEIGDLKDQLEMSKNELERKGKNDSDVEMQLREELVNAKATIRNVNQANSKLEAKLSNAQTVIETDEVEHKKFKEEVRALKDKIKWLEKRRNTEKEYSPRSASTPRSEHSSREDVERKLSHDSLRRSQERIRDLEQKIIQVNEEKQKLKKDYDEAVKALEAVDKVYSVRELALQQYKADLEDANSTIKQQSNEIDEVKMEADQLKKDYEKIEKSRNDQEQLLEDMRDQLARTKETAALYKTEIDEVRKEFRDQMHELQMAQAKARERGKKIQILDLELKETKETLQISKNVIDEKQKNMDSLQESLEKEKKNCTKLEQELDEMFYLKKKLQLIEDEKARVVEKLRATEETLQKTREKLDDVTNKNKEIDKRLQELKMDNLALTDKSGDQKYQIEKLRSILDNREDDIEQQLIEIIHYREQLDQLTLQLQEAWATYNADKTLGKNGKTLRRRPHSASMKRTLKAAPTYQSPPSKQHSYAHRRLVNKLGEPVINPNYINSTHKTIPQTLPPPQEAQPETDGQPHNRSQDIDTNTGSSAVLSPRPPNEAKPRPMSSYGVRTYPPASNDKTEVSRNGFVSNGGNVEDIWMYKDGGSSVGGDSDEQIVQLLVNTGDRVLIQSKVVGDELLNVSGVVRFVGKVGKKSSTSPVYVGLKLDQPFGDNNGVVNGKQFFKCPPRHGKLIKMSDIHAVMHPRTGNFKRMKSSTTHW